MAVSNFLSSTAEGVFPFYLDHAHVKGRLIRLGSVIEELLANHQYPDFVNQYVAELVALTAALSVDVKYDGIFTLQVSAHPDHEGPIRLITVDINTQGHVRAYAQLAPAFESTKDYHSLSLLDVFGQGFMVFTADLAHQTERYQAIVELTGKTLADCMHHFFRQSDQIATGLVVFSQPSRSDGQLMAGALILQRLPLEQTSTSEQKEQEEDDWITNLSLLGTLTKHELLDADLGSEQLLHRLFHERQLQLLEPKSLKAQCSCSKDRIEKVIQNFPLEDRMDMAVDGEIKVVCEFCTADYRFGVN
ncbi:Hsp33 family molecular chaperone HslO [Candidatus Finniella inopinata]|nr:Hsp33 family molecular chaperone HslO [Candidatus Finniella inopinata]